MSERLIGVVIGGSIAIIGRIVSQYIRIKNKRKDVLCEKKEKTYLKAIDILTKYLTEIPENKNGTNKVKVPRNLKCI